MISPNTNFNRTQLQALLTPNITLFATAPDGSQLSTTLSTDEATFVHGVFSDLVASESQSSTAVPSTAAAPTPFKLPGTRIEIVPIGLYFYGSYLTLACIIFGYGRFRHIFSKNVYILISSRNIGTFERQRFRDQYRKRMAQQGALGGNRAI